MEKNGIAPLEIIMDTRYLEAIIFFLVLAGLVFALQKNLRDKFWYPFGTVIFPLLMGALFIFNLISYPTFNKANKWNSSRLPSNELIDLLKNSLGQPLTSWIYPLIEDHYPGRILYIPESISDSLDLSLERMKNQGRLADVIPVELNDDLTREDVDLILEIEHDRIDLNERGIYHFIIEERSPESPLLLLKFENWYFFIPEDLLPNGEDRL